MATIFLGSQCGKKISASKYDPTGDLVLRQDYENTGNTCFIYIKPKYFNQLRALMNEIEGSKAGGDDDSPSKEA